jgi:hypothetical protein
MAKYEPQVQHRRARLHNLCTWLGSRYIAMWMLHACVRLPSFGGESDVDVSHIGSKLHLLGGEADDAALLSVLAQNHHQMYSPTTPCQQLSPTILSNLTVS